MGENQETLYVKLYCKRKLISRPIAKSLFIDHAISYLQYSVIDLPVTEEEDVLMTLLIISILLSIMHVQ